MGERVASELVAQRFPNARAAWLGGSVARYGGPLFAGFQLAGTDPQNLACGRHSV
jgi:hypothetical protein